MSIDVSRFDSIEDVDVFYKKQRAKAPDAEAERAVEAARLAARAAFFEARAQRTALEVARRDALNRFPHAKRFASLVNGSTPAEIEQSAKTVHKEIEALLKSEADDRELARAQYGASASSGPAQPTEAGISGWTYVPAPIEVEIIREENDEHAPAD